ncbi:hypothetical protein [Streptomyces sp. Qhu_M48]|uniref:hypothetical protein n=1 Tax=Streptomyces sp. Qhu_M48 TaxID=3435889 RepID=UPI003F5097E0
MRRAIRRVRAGHWWGRVVDLELWQRSLGFSALGFLTLVPLLIVVSAADPASGRGFARWLGDGLGVSTAARLVASSAVTYGPIGTVLVIQSWLVDAC